MPLRIRWIDKDKIGGNPNLRVAELDQPSLVHHNLVPLVLTRLEQLRQREPLPCHLVPVVCVYELVVVDAVCCVPLHALDGWLAAVERDNVIHEALAGGRERDAGGGVGGVVFGGGGLAGLVLFARGVGGEGPGGDGVGHAGLEGVEGLRGQEVGGSVI